MDEELTQLVWARARNRCEYCQSHQDDSRLTFEIDHIIAIKHRGDTVATNLALSCFYCNSFKGPNIAGKDRKPRSLLLCTIRVAINGLVTFAGTVQF